MGKVVRESVLEGMKLKVTPKKDCFHMELIIPKGTYLPKKSSNKSWSVNFRIMGGERKVKETIRIKFESQQYNKGKLDGPFVKVFSLDDKIEGIICIRPAFYLSERLREEYWRIREQEKNNKKKAQRPAYVGICTKVSGSGKPNTQYTSNNLYKPYQGGDCSPK